MCEIVINYVYSAKTSSIHMIMRIGKFKRKIEVDDKLFMMGWIVIQN